ncbi:hypothetical protein [Verminephrobacter aporrectodeae]|uniref:hypothetical protein n=1 Tax=Verminephrobacter aporrectodeae TaxID=1110389 RepID=UPI0022441479|nr:hypothetical protein [Verminephrobacter aporrectodeae]
MPASFASLTSPLRASPCAVTRSRLTPLLLAAAMALAVAAASQDAQARSKRADPSAPGGPTQAKKPSAKIKHQRSPSEESSAQRDRRLYRECQGRPNAGACLGYTKKP